MFQRNISLLYAMSFLQGLVFYAPVATLYRRAAGVSMPEIAVIESISLLLSLLLEMPWGVAADRIGYRRTMILCSFLFFLSKLIFWRAESFFGFLLERILLAVVVSGLSGVDSALLYLSCRGEREQRVFAVYTNLGTAGLLLGALLFSLFFGADYRAAGLWTAASYGAAALLSLFLQEPPHAVEQRSGPAELWEVIRSVLRRPRLLLLLFSFGLFQQTVQNLTVFLNQLQYERAGIPGAAMGYLLTGVNLLSLLGVLSPALSRRLGGRRAALLLFSLGALACAAMALTVSPLLSVAAVGMLALCGSLFAPMQAVEQNRQVRSSLRSTELSVYAMLLDSLAALTNLLFGRAAGASLPLALWLGCGMCLLGGFCYAAARRKSA